MHTKALSVCVHKIPINSTKETNHRFRVYISKDTFYYSY